ncbi:MAG: GntR family transcriptional regulator [Victivallales bacterium]|nr:GntR family transcriptional regulator [Victivallales bacterium]
MTENNPQILKRFIVVSDELAMHIVHGRFRAGEPFLSRQEICERYGISLVTAHKVQRKLLEDGFLSACAGGRFLVADIKAQRRPIRLVRFLGQQPSNVHDRFMDVWGKAMGEACSSRGIGFRHELHNLLDEDNHRIDVSCNWLPGEGIVSLGNPIAQRRFAGFLLRRDIPRVCLKGFLAGVPQVLTDSLDGLRQLLGHAKRQGLRRMAVIYSNQNQDVENFERKTLAPLVARELGMETVCCEHEELLAGALPPGCVEGILAVTTMRFNELQAVARQWPAPPLLYAFDDPTPLYCDFTGVVRYIDDYPAVCEAVLDFLELPRQKFLFDSTLQKSIPGRLVEGE